MAAVGSVIIGSKKIDIHSFTGNVTSSSLSSDTETTYEDGQMTQHRKWTYNKFVVEAPDGSTQGTEVDTRQASVTQGELVTLFWGVVGTQESSYLAVYQHASDKLGVVWETRNVLAGPKWLYNQAVLTTIAILFLIFFIGTSGGASVVVFLMLLALWYWMFRRRQKLVKAVQASIPTVKAQYSNTQKQSAAG